MKNAGFTGFERGEKGSSAEHLEVAEYKTQKEKERLAELKSETKIKKAQAAEFSEIDGMASKGLLGKMNISQSDWERVSMLAKEGIKSRSIIKNLKAKNSSLTGENGKLKEKLDKFSEGGITEQMLFHKAMQHAPNRLKHAVTEIMKMPSERQTIPHSQAKKKSYELE
jgi:multidrug resistance efflux pump